ncbi:MAG: hypothetical protein ACOC80_16525 [Petrotogales bacterium]
MRCECGKKIPWFWLRRLSPFNMVFEVLVKKKDGTIEERFYVCWECAKRYIVLSELTREFEEE